ncbi:hypothetical protein BXY41_106253 [Lacrimispora xylanisolvens]|uniref:Uncharacterized protein n=1 Tax=Lacrimispora xylanisolvens TaxID=384636 RepID=A0A2S6HSN7_9FIRM|nr:hypothetical protein [Hungatella xylanolytica]PPK80663.1 hypothetical protein BXY41_106253 [Hungatella xylanolytica]
MPDSNIQIFMNMYHGEGTRDASSKVRGFLFQDLIAVDELIKPQTEYVCSEYIEDVFTSAGNRVYIIQVKYYPKGSIIIKEIMRDLYYQYLRMKLYGYKGELIPVLAIHTKTIPEKPTLADMQGKDYINVNRVDCPQLPLDMEAWLAEHVYPLKKTDSENRFFEAFAWNDSIQSFLNALIITKDLGTLKSYREKIASKLNGLFSEYNIIDEDMRKNILLGLAVQYIQETYNDPPKNMETFHFRKRDREIFIKYLSDHISTDTEANIAAYMRYVVMDCWDKIEKFNEQLTMAHINLLQFIRDTSADWIYRLGSNKSGQLQLLNTISMKDNDSLTDFIEWNVSKRLQVIYEHRNAIETFLRYFWKILFNINFDLIDRSLNQTDRVRLMPEFYIDEHETRYLKIKFTDDVANSSVILSTPDSSRSGEELYCTFQRMKDFRPEKWYMCGKYHGKFSYEQNVSSIINNKTISILHQGQFRIECMECIRVDMECWHNTENCNKSIFLDKCINDDWEVSE